jgi:hypothetical protein
MSFYKDIKTVYFTKQIVNANEIDQVSTLNQDLADPLIGTFTQDTKLRNIDAVIQQIFRTPLLKNGSEWLMAVERFEVNLNGIPFYDNTFELNYQGDLLNLYTDVAGKILLGNRTLPGDIDAGRPAPIVKESQSLLDLLFNINQAFNDASTQGITFAPYADMDVVLDVNGIVTFRLNEGGGLDWFTHILKIPPLLNQILGMEWDDADILINQTVVGLPGTYSTWSSKKTRFDCGGFADHIRVVSNIGTTSDNVGAGHNNIITDLSVSGSSPYVASAAPSPLDFTGFSENGLSWYPNQKLVYNPPRLRFLNITDPSPIVNLRVEARYVLANGTTEKIIQLPVGCSFGIKFVFFSRQ